MVHKPQLKDWTVAIYMVADGPDGGSELDKAALTEMKHIQRAVAPFASQVNVAIRIDFKNKPGTLRRVVGVDQALGREENSADASVLSEFFEWVRGTCPARRYMVQFWGHSSGPVGLFVDRSCRSCEVDTLTLHELETAFANAKRFFDQPVDIVLFKDCWMSTLETAYQLKDKADFMIASQALVVPIEGWPYEEMFACLAAGSKSGTETIARELVEALGLFHDFAKNRRADPTATRPTPAAINEVPFAALDIRKIAAVEEPLKHLVSKLAQLRGAARAEARAALERASRGDSALLDVMLFCSNLRKLTDLDPELRAQAEIVRQAVKDCIVVRRPEESAFTGVSAFYFPATTGEQTDSHIALFTHPDDYSRLDFTKATKWHRIALENVPVGAHV